jgi:hypothetical protein
MASPKTTNPNKRACSARSPAQLALDDENNETTETEILPKYLVIESNGTENQLSKLSPFAIEKAMKGIAGEVESVKKLRSGVLLVHVFRDGQTKNLLKLTSFANVPVKVSAHRSLNSCKGVIRSMDLAQMDPEELVSELQSQRVTEARNIFQNKDGYKRKTAAIVLTFASSTLPTSVKAGFINCKVVPFIPNPLRCFKCQAFGHHQSVCKNDAICSKCGLASHGEEPCVGPVKCPNCSGNHPAYANSCPKWKQEKDICRIKVTNNISYPEARKQLTANTQVSTAQPSYAAVVKHTASVGTQTDVIHCKCIAQIAPHDQQPKQSIRFRTLNTQTDEDREEPSEGFKTMLGRLRPQSTSPVGKKAAARNKQMAKPPDRPAEGTQGAGAMDNTEIEALGSGYSSQRSGSRSSQGPRQKIGYPS